MGRMKIGIAVTGAVVVLVGVVAMVTMGGSSGAAHGTSVVSQATATTAAADPTTLAPAPSNTAPASTAKPGTAPATTKAPTKAAPAAKTPATLPLVAQPTAEDIQKVIVGITSEVLAPADATANTAPLTKDQVEAKVRDQLKQLGITLPNQ
jgi:hypothetical protein